MEDDLPDNTLFQVEKAPRWAEPIVQVLSIDYVMSSKDVEDIEYTLRKLEPYSLISGRLYILGKDQVLRLCTNPEDYLDIISEAHVSIRNSHASLDLTQRRILLNGFWWPTLAKDVANYIQDCPTCVKFRPISNVTLYLTMPVPNWASYIVDHLQGKELDVPRHRKRSIQVEAANFELIGDQLYKSGKDQNLRLCVPEAKYVQVLKHAHAGIAGGHFLADTTPRLSCGREFGGPPCTWMHNSLFLDVWSAKRTNLM